MRYLFCVLFLSSALFAQTNILSSASWPITIGSITVTVNATQDVAVAASNELFQTLATGVSPTTLTAAVTSTSQTSIVLANVTGISLGMGLCFSPSATTCGITMTTTGAVNNLTLSTGEIARVTAVTPGSGTTGTVTVVRAAIGTAATYSNGQAVTVTQYGSYPDLALSFIQAGYAAAIKNCAYQAYSCTLEQGAISTAASTLNSDAVIPKTN